VTTWTLPDPPPLDVTEVVDRLDKTWRRDETDPDLWWGDVGHGYDDPRQWHELLRRGPITTKD
jgi:hypothetical protein